MYVHKLHLAVSQPDARNTRHFSSGIIFTKRRSLARQSPTLVQNYIYIYTHALVMPFLRAAFAVFSAACTRALLISSKYETSKTVPSTIPLSPSPLSSAFQPGKNRGGYSNFDGLHPSVSPLATPIHLFYTLLLRAEFVLVRWKIRMAHDQPIITKIFFRVKVEKAIWLWLVMIVDCNWLCSSLI